MKISIFGLGYVGCVGLGCLAELGHELIGVDIDVEKVNLINNGKATIVEKEIDGIIEKNRSSNLIRATTNCSEAVEKTDIAIICVGTPNDTNGHLDMSHIYSISKDIGQAIKNKNEFFTIAVRSTVIPGTNCKIAEIIELESGKKNIKDFCVVSNPEFLREGTAVKDFFNPPYTVLASESEKGIEKMQKVYENIDSEIIKVSIGVAELIKFVNNSYHGLKVAFANEIGRICKSLNIDSRVLMELFVKDSSLNISQAYFKPGFAYGGSCLPKDLKALNTISHDNYIKTPILSSIEISNQIHIEYAFELIKNKNKKNIGFYGLSFKDGTDDLRFSPALEVAERLLGKGYGVRIYDKNINISKLMGKNKNFLFEKLPHINEILQDDLDTFISSVEIIVVVNKGENISALNERVLGKKEVVDLVRVTEKFKNYEFYEGICW